MTLTLEEKPTATDLAAAPASVSGKHAFSRRFTSKRHIIVWWLVAMVVGLMFTRLIPPFQSPDENVHMLRAAMLSKGQILLEPTASPKVRDSGLVEKDFATFARLAAEMPPIGVHPSGSALRGFLAQADGTFWGGEMAMIEAAGTGFYTPIIYLPHAVGLWLAQKLDLSLLKSYELTRAIVVGTALAIALYACTLWQPNVLMLMLLLLPMSVFQWFSPTIDGLCHALLLLLLALWLRLARDEHPATRWRDEALLYVLVFVICTTRSHLLPLLLIPFSLLLQRFSWPRLVALLTLVVSVLGWQVFAAATSGRVNLQRAHSTTEILYIYLRNPGEFFALLGRTLTNPDLLDLYYRSFAGLLGWLNVPLSPSKLRDIYSGLLVGLLVTLWVGKPWRHLGMRLACVLMAAGSVLLAFLALAISYNDYPTPIIIGIQGRYFIPVAMVLAFAAGPLDSARRRYAWPELAALLVFSLFSLHVTAKLLTQYYDLQPIEALLN